MERSERELVELAQAGNAKALERLLAKHEKQVYRFGLRMCGSEDAAREVLQETLLAAFKHIHSFRGEARLSTWLYQLARSFCLRSRRTRVGEPTETVELDSAEARAVESGTHAPDAVAHARELSGALQAAMLALPEAQREVLVLRDVEGLSAEEAARVVGVEVGALKSRLHRARMALRAHLAALLGDADEAPVGGASGACRELAEELADYAASDIDEAACVRIEAHLEKCEKCAAACDSLKRSVSLCRALPGGEVPGPVRAAVKAALVRAAGA